MKIVIAADLYYPMTDGVAVFAHNLAKGLAGQGHSVMVLCPSFTGKAHKVKQGGVTTVYLSSIRFPFYPDQINAVPDKKTVLGVSLPRLAYRHGLWVSVDPYVTIRRELKRFHPDVMHIQTPGIGVVLAAQRYARRHDIPLVSTGHSYPDNLTGQMKLPKLLKKPLDAALKPYFMSFLKHAECATMPTEIAIDDLVPKNRRRFKVRVEALSNGVDLKQFTPGRANPKVLKKFHLEKNVPRVLYVGRIDPEKSLGNVILAFSGVLDTIPDAELVIVGDGIDREHLSDLTKSLGIQKSVKFLGRILPPDVVDVYRSADLFATASETETQGIVLIEAAAVGLPLVTVDVGAAREICRDKKNGFVTTAGKTEQMTVAMLNILQDKKLQEKYAAASLKIAAGHDLNRTLRRFTELYEEAVTLKDEKLQRKRHFPGF